MPDWRLARPSRGELRAALCAQLAELAPGARALASELGAAESAIDLLLAGPDGEAIAIDFAEPGRELEALARAQAPLHWLRARIPDWRKLAPELPLRPAQPARALLLVQRIGEELRAAAAGLAAVELREFAAIQTPEGVRLLLLGPAAPASPGPREQPAEPLPGLRSSLGDSDLGLTPEEHAAFEE